MTEPDLAVPPEKPEADSSGKHRHHSHQRRCPECGEEKMERSRRHTVADYALSVFGLRPYRCHNCNYRFHGRRRSRKRPRQKRSRWAQCPRCGGTNVNPIARDKVPHTWENLPWRALPTSGYRCPDCRKRFFDFRRARPGR